MIAGQLIALLYITSGYQLIAVILVVEWFMLAEHMLVMIVEGLRILIQVGWVQNNFGVALVACKIVEGIGAPNIRRTTLG